MIALINHFDEVCTGSDLSKKSRGVVNVNRTVAKPKGTLEVGAIKRSMGVQPPDPPANRTLNTV